MLMTREMDYALRILRALHREEQLSAAEIAQRESIPKAITVKILKKLHTAGVVSSRRGSSGGYLLERSCEELSLPAVRLPVRGASGGRLRHLPGADPDSGRSGRGAAPDPAERHVLRARPRAGGFSGIPRKVLK